MLKRAGHVARAVTSPSELVDSRKIILPGVGSYDYGIRSLIRLGLFDCLRVKVLEDRVPTLGICLGMQLMAFGSEEGSLPGLGWVNAKVVRFHSSKEEQIKVPNMGWRMVSTVKESRLLEGLRESPRFYFVHSYYVRCSNPDDVCLTSQYGVNFDAAFHCGNVMGVQFHPEKSHRCGLQLLSNFAENF
jgi:glutamine amidotransferase